MDRTYTHKCFKDSGKTPPLQLCLFALWGLVCLLHNERALKKPIMASLGVTGVRKSLCELWAAQGL